MADCLGKEGASRFIYQGVRRVKINDMAELTNGSIVLGFVAALK